MKESATQTGETLMIAFTGAKSFQAAMNVTAKSRGTRRRVSRSVNRQRRF